MDLNTRIKYKKHSPDCGPSAEKTRQSSNNRTKRSSHSHLLFYFFRYYYSASNIDYSAVVIHDVYATNTMPPAVRPFIERWT